MICVPKMQHIASEAIEIMLAPKTIARQLTLAIALETGVVCINSYQYLQSKTGSFDVATLLTTIMLYYFCRLQLNKSYL